MLECKESKYGGSDFQHARPGRNSSVGRTVDFSSRRLISGLLCVLGVQAALVAVLFVSICLCVCCVSTQRGDIACVSMIPSVGGLVLCNVLPVQLSCKYRVKAWLTHRPS